jgi:hypothetical protein
MKKVFSFSFLALCCAMLISFSASRGGDVLQIYLNGRQVHQQFVQVDKSVKTLSLSSLHESDRIEIFYSHCGYAGKNRVLRFENERGEMLKEMKFPDAANHRSRMLFHRKDVSTKSNGMVKLYYFSQELPEKRWIATITWTGSRTGAKTASL